MTPKREFSTEATSFSDPGLKHPTVERAMEVDADLPFERLKFKLNQCPFPSKTKTVLHWFRTKDLRLKDNRGLVRAAQLCAEKNTQLITLFILPLSELKFHGVGDVRSAFMAENIQLLNQQLSELNIPLALLVSNSRKQTVKRLVDFIKANDVSHVFANFEYEYDELVRDLAVAEALRNENIGIKMIHDQTVVEPGTVTNSNGEPKRVFTRFWETWIAMLAKDPHKYYLELDSEPSKQKSAKTVIGGLKLTDIEQHLGIDRNREDIRSALELWPAGYDGAIEKLDYFIANKIKNYSELRSIPNEDCVSRMSPYLAFGLVSVREVLKIVRQKANNNNNFSTSSSGVNAWVREIAFREHYRQMVACVVPHIVMNMPSSLKLAEIRNEENEEAWKRWCEGTTGIPFVDAGMRQLNTEAYMHNRCRMNVASYLRMNLLIDYRLGLRYFANKLIDWDCCNNSFGWDPNYTVFNPVLQGEKCDPDGEYIRKWVPELKSVKGKAIFDPYNRLDASEFKKLNYPKPMIDQNSAKSRSVDRFKEASAKRTKQDI